MIFYKSTPNGDTDFFDAGVLQGDTSVPDMFKICQDDELQTSIDQIKENDFTIKQTMSSKNYNKRWQRR